MYVAEAMTLPGSVRSSVATLDRTGSSLISASPFDAALLAATALMDVMAQPAIRTPGSGELDALAAPDALSQAQPAARTPGSGELDALAVPDALSRPDAQALLTLPNPDHPLQIVPTPADPTSAEASEEPSDPLQPDDAAEQAGCPLADAPTVQPALPLVLPVSPAVASQAGLPLQRADKTTDQTLEHSTASRPLPHTARVGEVMLPTASGSGVDVTRPHPNHARVEQAPSLRSSPAQSHGSPLSDRTATGPAPSTIAPLAVIAPAPATVSPSAAHATEPPTSALRSRPEASDRIPPVPLTDASPDGLSNILPIYKEIAEEATTGHTEAIPTRPQTLASINASSPQSASVQSSPSPIQSPFSTEHPEWHAGLVERVVHQLTANAQSLDLTLSPENLGRVHIRLELQDGAAQVFFTTETSEAAKLFAANESQLADLFSRAGVTLAGQDTMREGSPRGAPSHQPATAPQRQPPPDNQTPSHHPHTRLVNLVA